MKTANEKKTFSKIIFICILVLVFTTLSLYLYNIIRWGSEPDFGFYRRTATGIKVIGVVTEHGRKAGLQVGDRILKVNGREFASLEEYDAAQNKKVGERNTYLLGRGGSRFEVSVENMPLGIGQAFVRSGLPYLVGLCYILIGIVVFLMKPYRRASWVFLLFAVTFGSLILFLQKLGEMRPGWLGTFHILFYTFTPATYIHLAVSFPEERNLIKKYPLAQVLPYLISLFLFMGIRLKTPLMADVPKIWAMALTVFLLAALLVFLGSCLQLWLMSSSEIVKLRSKIILLGAFIAGSVPLFETFANTIFRVYVVPSFNYYLPFFIVFPLSIGYSIVKHDLFDFDTIIKRTYGYVLTTGAIASIYGSLVLVSNVAFGRFEITKSPLFPLVFVLAVLIFFNPVRNRVQKIIDRVFYRLEYDYRETVSSISESMRTLLGLDEIGKSIMETALGTMFIDSGRVMLLDKERHVYGCLTKAGKREKRKRDEDVRTGNVLSGQESEVMECSESSETELSADDPFVRKIAERKREVTVYDIQENPLFASDRESCEEAMERMEATLVVPLIYEEDLIGLISLGEKKSGKFYRREDINLLNILANQGAVAIENALMVEEVIEKERMEEELSIAKDLQVSMLPAVSPEMEGFEIASFSESAREVGGDFFDFIEMGEGRIGLVLGDVTGKSVSGALVMAAARSVFRMLSEQSLPIGKIMDHANRRMKKDIKSGMFVALLYGVLDGKERSVRLSSAGQTQPVHLSNGTGKARLVETEGDTFPLGILAEAEYMETLLELEPGDTVVFYTDGIVEAMNSKEEIFGFERLMEVVEQGGSDSAEGLMKRILDEVNTFVSGAEQHDDITVIVVRCSD